MPAENIVAALDIGTTKVLAVIGEMDDQGAIYVIGHGWAPAEGLRRGVVVDMDKTVRSFRKAVDDAEMVSGVEVDRVTVGIAGEHLRSINSTGVVAVSRSDNEITAADVEKAIQAARTVAIPVDREIIHVVPQGFSVDDQTGIKDPVGMSGVRLEVEAHIVTASVTSAKNIYRALDRCHLGVNHVVLESLALSEVLLTETDLEAGCVLLDIGGDITNLSIFYNGAIRHTAIVPLGSRNVTNDIAIGLRTSVTQAEELKVAHGATMSSAVDPTEMISVAGVAGRAEKEVSCSVLAAIIEPRMEEIYSLAVRELRKVMLADSLTAGIVLTGGGALLPGTVELAEQVFDMPARIESVKGITHIPDDLGSAAHAAGLGLLAYGFSCEPDQTLHRGAVKSWLSKLENWITKRL
ncbi:MAG: cell division protein FtsA [Candidatus Zixiibacteriota bacterium]|nr:MAG: cell division protein FtsA [candidate division Zixibacteria bacterium]